MVEKVVGFPGPVMVEEKLEAPDIDLDLELRKVINIRAGGSLRLFVPIKGRPTPEVKWGKVDGEMTQCVIIFCVPIGSQIASSLEHQIH